MKTVTTFLMDSKPIHNRKMSSRDEGQKAWPNLINYSPNASFMLKTDGNQNGVAMAAAMKNIDYTIDEIKNELNKTSQPNLHTEALETVKSTLLEKKSKFKNKGLTVIAAAS